jgi:hypothetical protein
MNKFRASILSAALLTGTVTLLTACGGGGGDSTAAAPTPAPAATETVSGTAATGKAFSGTVVIVNKDGKASDPVTIKADGTFSVVAPKGAPYLIKANNGKAGDALVELYSFLADATKHVNVTQLTTQAVYDANAQAKLNDLFNAWATHHADLTQDKIDKAAKKVAANLKNQLTAAGLNPKSISIFNDTFKTDSTGLDKVLDQVKISYNCNVSSCNVNYTVNGFAFEWNYSVDITGYNVVITHGGDVPTGNFDLKITINILGTSQVLIYKATPKPANQTDFCVGAFSAQLPPGAVINTCNYSGNTGTISATVNTQGINTDFTATYEFVPAT